MNIPLPCGKIAMIDDEDHHLLAGYNVYSHEGNNTTYVACKTSDGGPKRFLHRMIMRPENGLLVDHRNHDGLDNRKSNLRVCSRQQNQFNAGKRRAAKRFKGVYLDRRTGLYYAQIYCSRRAFGSHGHATEEAAAAAYDALALVHHGEFAFLNNPYERMGDHADIPHRIALTEPVAA